jgi:hypothetical protein
MGLGNCAALKGDTWDKVVVVAGLAGQPKNDGIFGR